jgi:16S rRNA (cytosine967-C5)-methyltransferase
MTISPARRAAFEILRRVELEGAYASVLLAGLDHGIRENDRSLCHELVLGILRRQLWLDCVLEHFANRDGDKIDLPVMLALRLGLYQLRFLSRVPPSAAVNESVNLVREAGLGSAASFANAVLRQATREPNYDPTAGIVDADEKLAIETSHPKWLITRWANTFGFDEAARFAHTNNEPAPTAFRLTAKAHANPDAARELIKALESEGVKVSPSKIAPDAFRVGVRTRSGSDGIKDSTSRPFLRDLSRDGLTYLQDEASQLVAHLLCAQPGDRVLDICAAPGSKTTHLAALTPQALIVAGDVYEHRLRTLNELAEQQRAENIMTIACDATHPLPFADASFDRVLVDAPCSGTGTLRRNPEIRWRLSPSDIDELSQKQTQILANASAVVRVGGRLVYSTCSVEPEENEQVVENFLKGHEDFRRALLDVPAEMQTENGAVRTWPHRHDTESFFIAAFERTA